MKKVATLLVVPLMLGAVACSDEPVAVEPGNILETAAEAGTFTTLITAVETAGLASVLEGEGPFTVFAPTDEAFAQLPPGTVEALLNDIPTLTSILTYHVVPGRITSADLVSSGGAQPATVQGQNLTIAVNGGTVTVDGATVITADVIASNGVIHVIDSVILPPS